MKRRILTAALLSLLTVLTSCASERVLDAPPPLGSGAESQFVADSVPDKTEQTSEVNTSDTANDESFEKAGDISEELFSAPVESGTVSTAEETEVTSVKSESSEPVINETKESAAQNMTGGNMENSILLFDKISAEIRNLDLNNKEKTLKSINGWVKEKTHELIPSVLNDYSEDTAVMLINTVYFESNWRDEWDFTELDKQTFTLLDGSTKEIPLTELLKEMGLKDIFSTDKADLSGISEQPLFVSNVLQKTKLELDEYGTKAAAITMVAADGAGSPNGDMIKEVFLKRPFAFLIYDESDCVYRQGDKSIKGTSKNLFEKKE